MKQVSRSVFDFKSHAEHLVRESARKSVSAAPTQTILEDLIRHNQDMTKIIISCITTLPRTTEVILADLGSSVKTDHRVKHTNESDALNIHAQLDKLRDMKPGWLDGEGKIPSHVGLDWLSDVFKQYYPERAPPPYAYPTPEGGVEIEWSIGKHEISLEIDLENHTGEWSSYNVSTDASQEKTFDLDDVVAWQWIVDQVSR